MINGNRSRCVVIAAATVLVVVIIAGYFRMTNIVRTLPYVCHVDESQITENATRITETGSLYPGIFHLGSFPIYMVAAAFFVGQEVVLELLNWIGKDTSRYFNQEGNFRDVYPDVIDAFLARAAFCLLSLLTILLAGTISARVLVTAYAAPIAVVFASLSPLFFYHSYVYINVDIVSAFFVTCLLAFLFSHVEANSTLCRSVIPGVLCGAAIASKYPSGLSVVPAILTIVLFGSRKSFLSEFVIFITVTSVSFFLFMPYLFLNFSEALAALKEISVNQQGWPGYSADPGITQFFYYCRVFYGEFGLFGSVLGLFGMFYITKRNWRFGLILLSYPILSILFFSMFRTHWNRNILSLMPLFSVFIAGGIVAFFATTSHLLGQFLSANRGSLIATIMTLGALYFTVFYENLPRRVTSLVSESRNEMTDWIERNVQPGSTVVVASETKMVTTRLKRTFNVLNESLSTLAANESELRSFVKSNPGAVYVIPDFGIDKRWADSVPGFREVNSSIRLVLGKETATFGRRPVLLNYFHSIHADCNPKISLVGPIKDVEL